MRFSFLRLIANPRGQTPEGVVHARSVAECIGSDRLLPSPAHAADANLSAANHPAQCFEAAQQNCHEPCVRQSLPTARRSGES
jgi:hypothetical protein